MGGWADEADVAIAAVLDAMQSMTKAMEDAAYDEARDSSFWITDEIYKAMLAAFRAEALGESPDRDTLTP